MCVPREWSKLREISQVLLLCPYHYERLVRLECLLYSAGGLSERERPEFKWGACTKQQQRCNSKSATPLKTCPLWGEGWGGGGGWLKGRDLNSNEAHVRNSSSGVTANLPPPWKHVPCEERDGGGGGGPDWKGETWILMRRMYETAAAV